MDEQEWAEEWEKYSRDSEESNLSQESNPKPRPPSQFLKDMHELFTIIGVFAAVAFYFVQFENVPTEEIQAGLVSSLVIFVIVGLVAVNQTMGEASRALEAESGYLTTTYTIFAICLMGLMFSIYSALDSYAPSINPVLSMFASIAITIFYGVGIFTDTDLRQHSGWWISELLIYYSPHLAVLIGVYRINSVANKRGESIIEVANGDILTLTFSLIIIHLVLIFVIAFIARVLEEFRNQLKEINLWRKTGILKGEN